jgi:hypothetical protein
MSVIYKDHSIRSDYRTLSTKVLKDLWAKAINRPFSDRYLLSQSAKIVKGEKFGYLTGVCYMSPAVAFDGGNTCSHHKAGDCRGPCLVSSGHMALDGAVEARADRLALLLKDPALYFEILSRELKALQKRAKRKGIKTAGRMNGTTDLDWSRIQFNGKTIFQHFPRIAWYDYTKNPKLAENYISAGISVTFSWYKRADTSTVLSLLDRGVNVAIAYKDRLAETQKIGGRSVPVINGDQSDLRFEDVRGVVVGLKYKFATMSKNSAEINARALESGFIINSDHAIN